MRAHAGSDCFDREWVNAIVNDDRAARAHGVSSSQNGAEIAGIAKGLRDDPDVCAGAVNLLQRRQPVTVDADQGLRIILARNLAQNIRAGDDHVAASRSEEHTSELQSLMRNSYAVFCLKKKKK